MHVVVLKKLKGAESRRHVLCSSGLLTLYKYELFEYFVDFC